MNILFIGPYRQFDSWGYKSHATLKSLQNTTHTVASRPIFLSNVPNFNSYHETSEQIRMDKYDIVIQYLLQPYATYVGGAKNIGIFNYETIPYNTSKDFLISEALMDEIWTDSSLIQEGLENILQKNTISTNVVNVPTSLNLEKLPANTTSSYERDPISKDRFMFYCFLNPFDIKDGFKEICSAYLNTFTSDDLVSLTLFTEEQVNPQKITDLLSEYHKSLGHRISPHDQPPIHVKMPEKNLWTMEDKVKMHQYGDSFISISRSLCSDITVLEAAVYQKNPIITNKNAAVELLTEENVWTVESYNDYCLYNNRPIPFRYTAKELWNKPNIYALGQTMYECFVNKRKRDQKAVANQKLRSQFTHTCYEKYLKG